jgi:peptidyl-prolyl cis-trans isomerase D
MVISLAQVNRPAAKDIEPARVAAIAGPLGPAFGNELVAQMMQEARKRVGVTLNQKLIDQLTKELTGAVPVAE